MDIESLWKKALARTEIVRARIQMLLLSSDTQVPYILLCESSINHGDTVVRTGSVNVSRPSIIVPPNNPQFEGFDFEGEEALDADSLINFLLIRGISLPSMNYDNKTNTLDMYEGRMSQAVKHYEKDLQQKEDVSTGLIIGHEDCWQLSLLIFVCSQIARNADADLKKLMNDYKKDS